VIYHIITIFPEIFESFLKVSLIGKALNKKLISVNLINLRDYSENKRVDSTPYGGGPGMIFSPEPVCNAVVAIKQGKEIPTFIFSPKGEAFSQDLANNVSQKGSAILICPRYEGFDQRIVELTKAREISLGKFIIMGGELPAMLFIEATARLIKGVIGNQESLESESFASLNLVEYPQYTKPAEFHGETVPQVLLSGNHKEIDNWRKKNSYLTG